MATWSFRPLDPGGPNREPVYGEFFATDAISDPGMALVRESIQNSLDAQRDGEKVLVRISLSGEQQAAPASAVKSYFPGAWEHFRTTETNGLRADDIPDDGADCPFLVVEDFGTSGLTGEPSEAFRSRTGAKNHFYHFFRAEGQSDKDRSDRGSWGVGKHVFHRSSRISTVFGLTVRSDDHKRFLMGKAVLKSHYVGGDRPCQDGYFGIPPNGSRQLVMPLEESALLGSFCDCFDLQRGKEPGLSLVVPWPDPDVSDESLVQAVVRDYFFPILSGQLDVIVETPSVKTVLDSSTLISEVRSIGGNLAIEMQSILELADWARTLRDSEKPKLNMPDPKRAWKWSESLVPEELRKLLRKSYNAGERLTVRVPVTVHEKGQAPRESFFDLYLVRDAGEHGGRPIFIREGVIVTKVNAPRTRSVRALVVAEHPDLTAFLRDAENPSHTEWQHDGSNFRGKYKSGRSDLTFVKRTVHELVHILTAAEKEEDPNLLADIFSIPAPPDEEEPAKTKKPEPKDKEGGQPPGPPQPPTPKARRFTIQRVRGGFSVLPGARGTTPPERLEVRVGYNVRRGNALKKYSPADFSLDQAPIRLEPPPSGIEILECKANRLLLAIREKEFSIHVTGFDERRDLYVRAQLKEEEGNGGQEA